jgi:hypothetical protein
MDISIALLPYLETVHITQLYEHVCNELEVSPV